MIAGDQSRRLIVGGTILLAHAAAFYVLGEMNPHFTLTAPDSVVEVRFILGPSTPRQWQPPQVKTVPLEIRAAMPAAPIVDAASMVSSERAISPPVQQSPAPATPDRSAPRLVASVEYLREPFPRYPPQSRKLREQGLVVLRVLIDEQGVACSIEVETSSGHERLDHAAREAVARAAFRPYMEDGLPRRALVLIPIEFSLNRGSA